MMIFTCIMYKKLAHLLTSENEGKSVIVGVAEQFYSHEMILTIDSYVVPLVYIFLLSVAGKTMAVLHIL